MNLSGNSSPPYTYIWSNESTDPVAQNLSAGSYWLYVTDSSGCYETTTISLPDPFALLFGELASPTCSGDSNGVATVVSSGCPCMFTLCTFLWDNGDKIKQVTHYMLDGIVLQLLMPMVVLLLILYLFHHQIMVE